MTFLSDLHALRSNQVFTMRSSRLNLARFLILLVLASNLQAALAFLLDPGTYAPAFELTGVPGQAAVRGIAVLFLMWNIPYLLAAWHPLKNLLSLKEAALMQTTGLLGETAILLTLPAAHPLLRNSIQRFIAFDAAGLLLLLAALCLMTSAHHSQPSSS